MLHCQAAAVVRGRPGPHTRHTLGHWAPGGGESINEVLCAISYPIVINYLHSHTIIKHTLEFGLRLIIGRYFLLDQAYNTTQAFTHTASVAALLCSSRSSCTHMVVICNIPFCFSPGGQRGPPAENDTSLPLPPGSSKILQLHANERGVNDCYER